MWTILSDAHKVLTSEHFDYRFVRSQYHLDLASIKCNKTYEKTLIYLNSVVNYSIWRHRNDIRYRFINFKLTLNDLNVFTAYDTNLLLSNHFHCL